MEREREISGKEFEGKMKKDIIRINRIKAPPSKETFKIKPIRELLKKYVKDGKGWIDPFAGDNSPAEFTNDLNPKKRTKHHLQAVKFCEIMKGEFQGALFDPPYSVRQIRECYDKIGIKEFNGRCDFYSKVKEILAKKIIVGGLAISFGWNSVGFGKLRGFEVIEILLVCHSGQHNDTIVTVEKKIQENL